MVLPLAPPPQERVTLARSPRGEGEQDRPLTSPALDALDCGAHPQYICPRRGGRLLLLLTMNHRKK